MATDHEFCIYQGETLPSEDLNNEHIIPLALGGVDDFVVRASKKFNSGAGKLEGQLAVELGMWQRRNEFDVRGHSGKRPVPTFKQGRIKELDLPVQVELDKRHRSVRVYSPRDKRFLEDREIAGRTLTFTTTVDLTVKIRFAAKVALGAGYFAYGSKFAENARVELLRALIELDEERMSDGLIVIDPLDSELTEQQKIVRELGRLVGRSSVVIVPSENDISFCVTCLGAFCGILRIPADTAVLPNEGSYRWGHVLACEGTNLRRGSLKRGLSLLKDLALRQRDGQKTRIPQ